MIEPMNLAILIGSGLIVASIFTSLVSFRIGAPLLLIFLAVGLAAGEGGIGGIVFNNAPAAYFIGSIALAIILFDSGFDTRLQSYRVAAGPAITLASVGVLLTTGLVGLAAHLLLGFAWIEAMLIGAIISSTDAAAVFFLLRVGGIMIRDRVRSTLEVESSSNDPMAIFLTISLVELIAKGASAESIGWELGWAFALQITFGAGLGVVGGYGIVQVMRRITLESGLYPIAVLSLALCVFAATNMLGGSGFLAVYIAGLIAGNNRLPAVNALRRFQSGMTWLSQIAMFLTLGLLATPSQFPEVLPSAVLLALVLTFVARPLAVWLCLLPFRFSRNETTFIAWVGLRGAVSILLGILPLVGNLPNGAMYFNIAFIIVVTSLLIQGWTIRPMAKWLGLIVPPRIGPVERVELELPGKAAHELVAYRIAADSPIASGQRVPRWARPSLIVRDGASMRIHHAGRLQAGDYVYIFTAPRFVPLLDRLFAGRAKVDDGDRAFYGDFGLAPDVRLGDVARNYGFTVSAEDEALTLGEFLRRAFAGRVELGDRLPLGLVELIVRGVTDDGEITEVGLALEPSRVTRPRLPVLQHWKKVAAYTRAGRTQPQPGARGAEPSTRTAERELPSDPRMEQGAPEPSP